MNVKILFDKGANTYDQTRRQLVPCFGDFYATVLELIPFQINDSIQALDWGAGTGLLSAFVAETFPQAHITLVDISPAMLNKAQERLANESNRFQFQVMNLAQESIAGVYDVIVSALAIHHLTDTEKLKTFKQIFQALKPNGIFINADQILGDTPATDQQ